MWGISHYAYNTVRTYTDLIGRFIRFLGDKDISEVEITDITRYYTHLKAKKYHDSSIAYMMISLRQMMKYLCLRRLVEWDYQLIRIPKYVSNSYTPVETAEARAMIEKIKIDRFLNLRNKVIMLFLYSSGVRNSELCGLRLGNLRLNADRPHAVIISKKNQKKRMIFWNEETLEYLKIYLEQREVFAATDHVFISLAHQNFGHGLTTRSIERFVEEVRLRPGISPHSFRHGFGMREVKARIHPRYIQIHLGHKNINSSQVYMDVCDEDAVKAYDEVGH